jgi:hypothetical protein
LEIRALPIRALTILARWSEIHFSICLAMSSAAEAQPRSDSSGLVLLVNATRSSCHLSCTRSCTVRAGAFVPGGRPGRAPMPNTTRGTSRRRSRTSTPTSASSSFSTRAMSFFGFVSASNRCSSDSRLAASSSG